MKNRISHTKTQHGMTLVELIAALAIISAVIVGALSLFDNASATQRAGQFYKDVQGIRLAIQQQYSGVGTYGASADLKAVLIAAKKVPVTMPIIGTNINSTFGGTVSVNSNAAGNQFSILATSIPYDVCTQLLLATNSGWASVAVGATTILSSAFPISPGTANTTCAAGFNSLTWATVN